MKKNHQKRSADAHLRDQPRSAGTRDRGRPRSPQPAKEAVRLGHRAYTNRRFVGESCGALTRRDWFF